VRDEVATQL